MMGFNFIMNILKKGEFWFYFVICVFVCVFAFMIYTIFYDAHLQKRKTTYSGVIVANGYEPPTSGYKSQRDPCYYLIMRDDSSHRNIRINVNVPTYYGLKIGCHTYFTISNISMYNYGNTSDKTKNLYGK